MPRTISQKTFTFSFDCDRCPQVLTRETDGDIRLPVGWAFLWLSDCGNQREGPLLCPDCVAAVLAVAMPAKLNE